MLCKYRFHSLWSNAEDDIEKFFRERVFGTFASFKHMSLQNLNISETTLKHF